MSFPHFHIFQAQRQFMANVLNCESPKKKHDPNHARTVPEPHAPEPRPNRARTTPCPNHARTMPEPCPNHARTTPEPRPNHGRPNHARTTPEPPARTAPEPCPNHPAPEPRPNHARTVSPNQAWTTFEPTRKDKERQGQTFHKRGQTRTDHSPNACLVGQLV